MKIVFDHQIFVKQRVGGISRYFSNLINFLNSMPDCEIDMTCFINKNLYSYPRTVIRTIPDFNNKFVNRVINSKKFSVLLNTMSERKTVKTLNRKRYDLLHLTGEDIGYLEHVRNRKPVVVTVHDLIPELYPDYFYNPEKILKERTAAFAKADVLICVSESTRNDLMKIYGINKEKTKVIYHGDPAYLIENPNTRDFLNPLNNKKYLLYIGSRASPYKNFIKMVTELTPFFRKNKDVFLLCIGERLSSEESAMFQTLDVKNRIFSAAIPDNALFLVYKHALCLVYPSLYEGFGFPVLEAMKAGCPILCSNSSSIPEVAQNGSLYFDPVNFHGFNENLNIILNDIHHIEMLRNNQKHILSKFSWQNAAIQTHQAYLSLI